MSALHGSRDRREAASASERARSAISADMLIVLEKAAELLNVSLALLIGVEVEYYRDAAGFFDRREEFDVLRNGLCRQTHDCGDDGEHSARSEGRAFLRRQTIHLHIRLGKPRLHRLPQADLVSARSAHA